MCRFLVSPTDGPLAKLLESATSSLPEKYGADVLAPTPKGLIGWQRKTVADLIASISDGRLAEGLPKLKSLPFSVLIPSGTPAPIKNPGKCQNPQRTPRTRLACNALSRT